MIFLVAREKCLCYRATPAGEFLLKEMFVLTRMSLSGRVIVPGSLILLCTLVSAAWVLVGDTKYRTLSGVIVTQKNEAVEGVAIIASSPIGEVETVSDADGNFTLSVPKEPLTLRIEGKNIAVQERRIGIKK